MNRDNLEGMRTRVADGGNFVRASVMLTLLHELLEDEAEQRSERLGEVERHVLALRAARPEVSSDVGPAERINWRTFDDAIEKIVQRLAALEAYRTGHDAYDLEVHGSLKALEGRVDAWERSLLRLEAMRTREQGAGQRGIVLELLDALLGPPDVGPKPPLFHRPPYGFDHPWTDLCPVECLKPDVGHQQRREPASADESLMPGPVGHEWVTERDIVNMLPKRGATPCPVCGSTICMGDPKACDQRAAARKAKP